MHAEEHGAVRSLGSFLHVRWHRLETSLETPLEPDKIKWQVEQERIKGQDEDGIANWHFKI